MKLKSIQLKLGHFRSFMPDNSTIIFQSRFNLDKIVKVKIQGDNGIALPIKFEDDSEVVVFHAKTIKQLVEFLTNK